MQLIEGDLAYETLAGDCQDPAAGKPVFLLDDTNTHTAAGRNISKLFDTLLPDNWNALKTIFAGSRSPEHYAQLMRRTGYPLTLKALNVSPSEFLLAVETSRTIRDRITVLDLAAHAGVLEDAAQKALALLT